MVGEIKPSKKDQTGYNGWWKIIGKKKVQEIQIDVENVNVENINKIDLDYSMVNYPNIYHNQNHYTNIVTYQQRIKEKIEYNLNYNYSRNLSRLEFRKQDKKVKIFDIKGQKIIIKADIRIIPKNIMHYCNENELGIKRICMKHNECIELNLKSRYGFRK